MATAPAAPPESPYAAPELSPGLKLLRSHSRAESTRAARDAVVLADLAERVPRVLGDERGGSAWTSFLREVAVARRCSDRAARSEVARALQLVRMPVALSLLAAGDLPTQQARALVEESWPASEQTLSRVDAEVSTRAVRLSPSRVRDAVRKVLLREEADAVAVRSAKAAALRSVRRTPLADDQAEIVLCGPALPLAQLWQALDHDARALRSAGDERPLDALRFDLAVDRGLGGHASRPSAGEAHAASTSRSDGASDPAEPDAPTPRPTVPDAPTPRPTVSDAPTPLPGTPPARPDPSSPPGPVELSPPPPPLPLPPPPPPPPPPPLPPCPVAPPDAGSPEWLTDRRWSRPVRQNISVPVTTGLGLSNEPGWLDGHGWISAPTCRQLLVTSELRRLCVDQESGQLVDLAPDVVRPALTPESVAAALREMATDPFEITDAAWQTEPQHDPSDQLRELVVLRDELCDGPTGARVPARRADLDHERPWPDGPTAAWNLVARGERTHVLKHRGWQPVRTPTSTLWFSPSGQVVEVPRTRQPLRPLEPDAVLPDPAQLHALEAELLRPPTLQDDPPDW